MRTMLPVLAGGELCEGCGRCCDKIGLPPFEVPNPDLGPMAVWAEKRLWSASDYTGAADRWLADTDTFLRMPAALRAAHARLVRGLTADPTGSPCAWLDPDSKRCSHYEFRPAVCRDWPPGADPCLTARKGRARVEWRYDNAPPNWRNPRRSPETPWAGVVRRLPHRWQKRLGNARRPVGDAATWLVALVALPWLAWVTARELRRGLWAARDLWHDPDRGKDVAKKHIP
jgi:Fe-S-cluster containining protein